MVWGWPMAESLTFEELRMLASRAGLDLADEELQRLLPVVNRSRAQAAALRELVSDAVEPSGSFDASKGR
jgi:hypothetical protein